MIQTSTGAPAGAASEAPASASRPAFTPLPDRSVVPPVWGRVTNIAVDHGEGSWLVTFDGERYLDYTSGIGVTNTGHAHPRVVAAVQAQAARLLHGQQNIVYHEPGLRLYERLSRILPGDDWGAFLSNSGAEAVEASVKLARIATGRPVIIGFRYGYHGRTGQTMALTTAKDVYRGHFEPLPGSIYHTPYRTATGRPVGRICRRRASAIGRPSST
jgi:4-aminobutyrate aminotransferase